MKIDLELIYVDLYTNGEEQKEGVFKILTTFPLQEKKTEPKLIVGNK